MGKKRENAERIRIGPVGQINRKCYLINACGSNSYPGLPHLAFSTEARLPPSSLEGQKVIPATKLGIEKQSTLK